MVNLLQAYAESLQTGDADRMASLFTEDAHFYDEAPTKVGMEPIDLKGKENLQDFFKQILANGGLNVVNVAVVGNAMRYDILIGDQAMLCLGAMTEENNLIKEYRVTAV